MKLWEALEIIQKEGPKNPEIGICYNAGQLCPYIKVYSEIANASPNWSGYSGNLACPIEGSESEYINSDNL